MHYQEKVDQLFNGFCKHRTLRTLFVCFAHEWETCSYEKKESILLALYYSDKPLQFYVDGFIHFYKYELNNKAYVVNAIPTSIRLLCQNIQDEQLKTELLKIKAKFVENQT